MNRARAALALLGGAALITLVLSALFFLYLPPRLLAGLSAALVVLSLIEGQAFLFARLRSTPSVFAVFNLGFILKVIFIIVAWRYWIPPSIVRPALLFVLLNFSGHYAWNAHIFHVESSRSKS